MIIMKELYKPLLGLTGLALGITALCGGLSTCNDYKIEKPNFTTNSRSTGVYNYANKVEYTILADGSEEILVRDGTKMSLLLNLDWDNIIDRIRMEKSSIRDSFKLENILIRSGDYSTHKKEFDDADKLLQEERKRYLK